MNATAPSPTRTAPLALWRVAQAFLGVLHMLFGDPEAVATRHTLTAKAHGALASWLRCGEAMLRRLILIEAGAYPKPNTRPLLRVTRKRARKLMQFWPEKPEEWRVSFRCFASPTLRQAAEVGATGSVSVSLSPSKAERPEPIFVFREGQRPSPRALRVSKRRAAFTGFHEAPAAQHGKRRLRQDREWVLYEPKIRFRSAWPLAERYEALLRVFNDPAPYARRLARRLHATPHRIGEALRAPPEAAHRVDGFEALGEEARSRWRPHFSSA